MVPSCWALAPCASAAAKTRQFISTVADELPFMKILTASEMKEVDRLSTERHNIPSLTLMENAGKSVAEFLQRRFPDIARRRIVVLCGTGNNGGDGFGVARPSCDGV